MRLVNQPRQNRGNFAHEPVTNRHPAACTAVPPVRFLSAPSQKGPTIMSDSSPVSLAAGQSAPDFVLESESGPVSLASLAGKAVVLYFYPKDDTSGCTREAQDFSALSEAFAAANTVVIGISPDSVASHAKFRIKHHLKVHLASDEAKTVLQAYGVWAQKSMYGRTYMGVERTTVLIDAAGTIVQIWRKVKVAGHAEAVLDAAQALGA